jgi:hypothetical protein
VLRQKENSRKKSDTKPAVDHIVSVKLWDTIRARGTGEVSDAVEEHVSESDESAEDNMKNCVNHLGNCSLLENNFNISKGADSMRSFLSKIERFKDDESISDWGKSLDISNTLLSPENCDKNEISTAIQNRTDKIRGDLVKFINGAIDRVDIDR